MDREEGTQHAIIETDFPLDRRVESRKVSGNGSGDSYTIRRAGFKIN